MSQSDAVSPDQQNRRAHRPRVRTSVQAPTPKRNRAGRNHGRGRQRRAFELPVHPAIAASRERAS